MSIYWEQFNFSLLKSFKQQKALGAESEGLRTREVLYEEAEQNL